MIELTQDLLEALAARHQPPQSWYEEDFDDLFDVPEVEMAKIYGPYCDMGGKIRMRKKSLESAPDSRSCRLARRVLAGCTFCPLHDGENRGRRPKPDKSKNHRRK